MTRGCPINGWMHRFDKDSHRCRCGRWERGFKPKCEPVKPRSECQICERQQALVADGTLGHHGYRRPGWGFIEGDCMGVAHLPYPAYDALEKYLHAVRAHIKACEEQLAALPTLNEIPYYYPVWVDHKKEMRTRIIKRGDEYGYDATTRQTWPGFDDCIKVKAAKLENDIAFAKKDEARVVARIEKAKNMIGNPTVGA